MAPLTRRVPFAAELSLETRIVTERVRWHDRTHHVVALVHSPSRPLRCGGHKRPVRVGAAGKCAVARAPTTEERAMKDAALPDAIAHNVITLKGVTRAGAAYWAALALEVVEHLGLDPVLPPRDVGRCLRVVDEHAEVCQLVDVLVEVGDIILNVAHPGVAPLELRLVDGAHAIDPLHERLKVHVRARVGVLCVLDEDDRVVALRHGVCVGAS
eukprot:CAMPEP_0185182848 /NCGR_PEP_ID=MMETSP1140-20130426/1617_1 /TAXON_ID=298111 /ORGANISM="Pavlova sp., Strain CCMP459" /LENGTH=212 /DNA_ID=CAMNT_0027748819 /DNA_START=597 /DNA_END=1232 /DNA_ORIENTATION=-